MVIKNLLHHYLEILLVSYTVLHSSLQYLCNTLQLTRDTSQYLCNKIYVCISSFRFNDNESCVELLLEKMSTSDINVRDRASRTVVHAAAFNDSVESLHMLLKRGVEVSMVDNNGQTPLMMAAKYGHTAIIGEAVGRVGGVDLPFRGSMFVCM